MTSRSQLGAASTAHPYDDNPLIDACGEILPAAETLRRLWRVPAVPKGDGSLAPHLVEHCLMDVRRLCVPSEPGLALATTVDVLMRQGYVHRRPSDPATWRRIYDRGDDASGLDVGVQLAATVVGVSGAGKSTALERALHLKPQMVIHDRFPHLSGPVRQLLWLKADVPASGKLKDLVMAWACAADEVLGTDYAEVIMRGRERSGIGMAREWAARMACHFPGLLVLDEIQNLFKIQTKSVRRSVSGRRETMLLRIVDDEALKFVLTLTNTNKFPLIVCGTPDGLRAFGTRMSTSQRLITGGLHYFGHAADGNDDFLRKRLLPRLFDYQWLPNRLVLEDGVAALVHSFTAGLPRICAALWVHAHRRALAVNAKGLGVEHLKYAAAHTLAPLQPAVQALLSGDPAKMAMYEDLVGPDLDW